MRRSHAKSLIGKRAKYVLRREHCPHRGYVERKGTLTQVIGGNIEINGDRLYITDFYSLEADTE